MVNGDVARGLAPDQIEELDFYVFYEKQLSETI